MWDVLPWTLVSSWRLPLPFCCSIWWSLSPYLQSLRRVWTQMWRSQVGGWVAFLGGVPHCGKSPYGICHWGHWERGVKPLLGCGGWLIAARFLEYGCLSTKHKMSLNGIFFVLYLLYKRQNVCWKIKDLSLVKNLWGEVCRWVSVASMAVVIVDDKHLHEQICIHIYWRQSWNVLKREKFVWKREIKVTLVIKATASLWEASSAGGKAKNFSAAFPCEKHGLCAQWGTEHLWAQLEITWLMGQHTLVISPSGKPALCSAQL